MKKIICMVLIVMLIFSLTSCDSINVDNAKEYFDISYSEIKVDNDWGGVTFIANFEGFDGWIYDSVTLTVEFYCSAGNPSTETFTVNKAGNAHVEVHLTGGYFEGFGRNTIGCNVIKVSGSVRRG